MLRKPHSVNLQNVRCNCPTKELTMSKPQILKLADKADLKKVPSKFSILVSRTQIGQTLIILEGDENKVVSSKEIIKILDKLNLKPNIEYTVVATNLTAEAVAVLSNKKINLLRTNNFYWTDTSHSNIKNSTR